jgi:hypothetical protein
VAPGIGCPSRSHWWVTVTSGRLQEPSVAVSFRPISAVPPTCGAARAASCWPPSVGNAATWACWTVSALPAASVLNHATWWAPRLGRVTGPETGCHSPSSTLTIVEATPLVASVAVRRTCAAALLLAGATTSDTVTGAVWSTFTSTEAGSDTLPDASAAR